MSRAYDLALRYARLSERNPWMLLGIYTVISALCVFAAWALMEIRTDLESLLPQGSPSVVALEESRARTGSTDSYIVAATSPDPEANVRFVEAMAAEIQTWPETQWVQTDRDPSFFAEHALLYMPVPDLEKLRDTLEDEIKLQKKYINPMFVDLRTPEERAAEDRERRQLCRWIDPRLPTRLGLDQETFDDFMNADELGLEPCMEDAAAGAATPAGEQAAAPPASAAAPPASAAAPAHPPLPGHLKHKLISPDGGVAVVMASLSEPATDVVKARGLMERGQAAIDKLQPETFHPEMRASVGGAYQNFKEVESISNDSTTATIISTVVVLVILLGFFRNGRSLLLLVVPLAMGIIWSLGLTSVTFGHLNISTLFVFSMLIGMGIDFGIHLYARILEEYRSGNPMAESIATAITSSGRGMLSAAATTVASLLTLLMAHFVGFIEFGLIASAGIALCLAAAVFVMPPLIFALERIVQTKRPEGGLTSGADAPALAPARLKSVRVAAVTLMLASFAGATLAGVNAEQVSFEHDFSKLRGPSTGTGISYGSAVGRKKSASPAMILGQDDAQMREVHEQLAQRLLEARPDDHLKSFITIQTYVPPEQEARMAVIDEIHELVEDKKLDRTKGKARDLIEKMRKLSDVKPFTVAEVPGWAQRSIQERDGRVGAIGYLYSSAPKWDAYALQDFQDDLGVIKTSSGPVLVASSGFILSDVVRTVKSDAFTLLPWIFGALALVLLLDLRSLKGTLVCLTSMAVALLFTLGGMIVFDIKVGLYNMIVLPMVLGTGIDGSIHIHHRYLELGTARIHEVFKTTGLSVAASSLTTLGGFLGLLFVAHQGVATIGSLAVVGISACLLAIFMVLPGLLLVLYPNAPGHASTEKSH